MLKIIITQLVLFFLPLVLYSIFQYCAVRWGYKKLKIPTIILLVFGGVLVFGGLLISTNTNPSAGSSYKPAQLIDGKISPGKFNDNAAN